MNTNAPDGSAFKEQVLKEHSDVIFSLLKRWGKLESHAARKRADGLILSIALAIGGQQVYLPAGYVLERALGCELQRLQVPKSESSDTDEVNSHQWEILLPIVVDVIYKDCIKNGSDHDQACQDAIKFTSEICEYRGGRETYFPSGARTSVQTRHSEIAAKHNTGKYKPRQLAAEYKTSVTRIYGILKAESEKARKVRGPLKWDAGASPAPVVSSCK